MKEENLSALEKGIVNLGAHIENIKKFNVPCVVAINSFTSDTQRETDFIIEYCKSKGVKCNVSTAFSQGGHGAVMLAETVAKEADKESGFTPLYSDDLPIKVK